MKSFRDNFRRVGRKLNKIGQFMLNKLIYGWSIMQAMHIVFLLLIAIFFLYIVWKLAESAYRVVKPATQIELEYKTGTTDLKEQLRDRWSKCLQPVELQRFDEIPIAIPHLFLILSSEKKDFLEDIKLNIFDVDFSSFYQKFSSIFQPSGYKVKIKKEVKDSKVEHLEMTLERKSEVLKTWLFHRHLICEDWETKLQAKKQEDLATAIGEKPNAGAKPAQLWRDEEDFLINHAFYELFYYLYFDEDNKYKNEFDYKLEDFPKFPSGRALCACYTGIRHLNNYQEYGNQAELDQALRFFQILQAEYPEFWQGSLLYGMALAENRDEPSAVANYDKALDEISGKIKKYNQELSIIEKNYNLNGTNINKIRKKINDLTITKFQTRLWRATALKRHYGWQTTHEALTSLQGLIEEIRENIEYNKKLILLKVWEHEYNKKVIILYKDKDIHTMEKESIEQLFKDVSGLTPAARRWPKLENISGVLPS